MNDVSETAGSEPVKGSLEFCGFQNSNQSLFIHLLRGTSNFGIMEIRVEERLEFCRFQSSIHRCFTESPYSSIEGNEQFWDRKIRILCKSNVRHEPTVKSIHDVLYFQFIRL